MTEQFLGDTWIYVGYVPVSYNKYLYIFVLVTDTGAFEQIWMRVRETLNIYNSNGERHTDMYI